jgi:DNA-binding CsgD family transcriptional regulator
MECGAILLKNIATQDLEIVTSVHMPEIFEEKIRLLSAGSQSWSRLMERKIRHMQPAKRLMPSAFQEGYKFISMVPILQDDQPMGSLIAACRTQKQVPEQARAGLEFLAAELGGVMARMQIRRLLEDEISSRRDAEKALEAERQRLQEANTALKVLLMHREEDKRDLEEKFVANVKQLVSPYVEKLKDSSLEPLQQLTVGFIESNLREILSPFLSNIRGYNFTPRQLEIVALIKQGRTTKEIARLLSVSKEAVDMQRFLIRKKLGLNKEKTNLRSHLFSLS